MPGHRGDEDGNWNETDEDDDPLPPACKGSMSSVVPATSLVDA
jgi:hypothetical protein